ncbi:potassium channel family protein [Halobacterium bonnevillei]|jgi:trk system potassium uptake protein TrkA|uniref:NAD(P)-binding domain-containing protein n=1 Tax=Halobacterium bonnevillei TaxID=2692200 RepID=A0A6B0SK13_9EURY|nr:TrkA family potassium uptake protein [Halobacterium bonnevillei]MXR19210.1 NAD(P)-binding domain-containing protein [Halobacterium bonnevillei]
MYIIIVGAGDIGSPLIEIATTAGYEVVVIEKRPERADEVASEFDCLVLNADATVKETLLDAGADRANAIITTTDQDATNVMVSLLAQELEIPTVVSVVHNPEHMSLFRQIGVHTMENPQRLIAESLFRSVERPSIVDYMRVGEVAEVFEITVAEDAPIAGLTLSEADDEGLLDEDTLVVAIERDGEGAPITPRGNTRIERGDLLTVYSGTGATPDVTDIFGHYEDRERTSSNGFGL